MIVEPCLDRVVRFLFPELDQADSRIDLLNFMEDDEVKVWIARVSCCTLLV